MQQYNWYKFFCPELGSYIWKRGILPGGKAREVSRNLQADRYMSKSAWEKFTGPFLSRAPRTTLASLGGTHKKTQEKNVFWKSIHRVLINRTWIKSVTYFEMSLSACNVFSRRANMRIWKKKQAIKVFMKIVKRESCWVFALCMKPGSHRMGTYQLCDHDWPKRCEVLGWNPQQENTKHQEDLGWNSSAGVHTQSLSKTLWKEGGERFFNWIRTQSIRMLVSTAIVNIIALKKST